MKKRRVNILCRKDVNGALNRYITSQLFESRILEHPQQAQERTSLPPETRISSAKKA